MTSEIVTFKIAVLAILVGRIQVKALHALYAGLEVLVSNIGSIGLIGHTALCFVGTAHADTSEAGTNFVSILVPAFFIFELIAERNHKRELQELKAKLKEKGE